MCLVCLSVESDFPFVLREEDEYSELRSELSQSQHEANEDSRSVDQDQTSVSVPENQSTMVTADMGKSACRGRNARARFLDCNQNFRSMRQPALRFSESSSLLSRWRQVKAHSFQFSTYSFVGHSGTKELNSLSALMFVIQTCHLLREKSGSREPGKKVIALFQVQWNWAVMARMERMGWGATHCRGGGNRFSNSWVSRIQNDSLKHSSWVTQNDCIPY